MPSALSALLIPMTSRPFCVGSQVSADASDVLFVETAMINQDQIERWEAEHLGR
jgi:hypothetical protein